MSDAADDARVGALVENLFRRESARLTAYFIRRLGPARAAQAEDVVQETLLQALKNWRFRGVPDNPSAWIWRVAGNRAIDVMRRDRPADTLEDNAAFVMPEEPADLPDAELELLFLCADPDLPPEQSIPLTLKLACGFGLQEIAGALSLKPETVSQRLVRAKRRWREQPPATELNPEQTRARIDPVLNVIYLLLNEGYGGHHPDFWQRGELCHEATRLALLLAGHHRTACAAASALAALCLFQSARLPARTDDAGEIILLHEQDRSLWEPKVTQAAFHWLQRAQQGSLISPYHVLAGIAAIHATAPTYSDTDWQGVVANYDQLIALDPASPFHALSRAIALMEATGSGAALDALKPIENHRALAGSYILPATRAHILARDGQSAAARRELIRAIALAPSEQPRAQLHRRLKALDNSANLRP